MRIKCAKISKCSHREGSTSVTYYFFCVFNNFSRGPAGSWRATVGLTSEYDRKAPVPNLLRKGPGKMVGLPSNCLSVHIFICSFIRHLSSTCEPSGEAEMMDMWSLLFSAHTRAHTYTGRLVPHTHLPSHLTWRPQLSAQRR